MFFPRSFPRALCLSLLLLLNVWAYIVPPVCRHRRCSVSARTASPTPSWFFAAPQQAKKSTPLQALPSPEESAKALTDFMAKAHEEKLRAVTECENKYKAEIESLKAELAKYEGDKAPASATSDPAVHQSSSNSYEFPATNKALTEKVRSYRDFISNYIVNSQIEKVQAVHDAEAKAKAKYEALMEQLKQEHSVLA